VSPPSAAGAAGLPARPGLPRWFDLVAAGAALLVLAPLLAAVALAVRLSSPGPVLFRQQRVGRGGQPFTMLKFRTMRVGAAGAQVTAAGDPRITSVGHWLRRWKLDELPELWNVVRGEMSLVGPRPEVEQYVDLGDPLWRQVLAVRPGITDPVTVALRNEEELLAEARGEPEEYYRRVLQPAKLRGYVEYLQARSWRSDAMVLFETLAAILRPNRTFDTVLSGGAGFAGDEGVGGRR